MKNLRAPFVVFLLVVVLLSAPVQAVTQGSILKAIPDDIYIHFFGGAAVAGWLDKHEVSDGESWAILIVGSVFKEVMFDAMLFGGAIDGAEVGAALLGALVYHVF
jgi:hypothetical protein